MSGAVEELRQLLGNDALLLPWPLGSKGTRKKWGHLTLKSMTPACLAKCEKGNIGVALGQKSSGLCVVDADNEEFAKSFLKANAHLSGTLQTRGARGCAFWFRFVGPYPQKTSILKSRLGEALGEFRSNGSQSIIHGQHPTGKRYQFIKKARPLEIAFGEIHWPDQIADPPQIEQCTEDTEEPEETDATKETEVVSPDLLTGVKTLEDAYRRSVPNSPHNNNHHLFTLARGVKALEKQEGRNHSRERLRAIFDEWHLRATTFLRPGQTKEEYFIEFLDAYKRVKYPLGSVIVPKAWKLAQEQPLPCEANQFENRDLKLLIALCWQLQRLVGNQPFYLSSRTCQSLLGHDSHTTAAKWLRALCVLQIIQEVEKGNRVRATRYRYVA